MVNEYNEKLKSDRKFALNVKKSYDGLSRDLGFIAREGGTRGNKAAKKLLQKMIEQNVVLYHLGFSINDNGRLIKLKKNKT